ncbi:hypothetical protein [Nocardioides pacificus]
MKSGTSHLQSLVFANRGLLAARGVLVPGESWAHQVRAVRDVLRPADDQPRSRWQALVEQVQAHDGTSLVSMEFLGPAGPRAVARVAGSFPGREVHVVLTVRDLNRSIVSMWQETIQNGRSWTWADYVADVQRRCPSGPDPVVDRSTAGGTFWRQQDAARVVRTWGADANVDRVSLVTLPPPGGDRDELDRRFSAASGIDLSGMAPVPPANESLGAASVQVLRRVNELLDEAGLRFPAGQQLRKGVLAKTILAERRRAEPAVGLAVPDWVRRQSAATLDELRAAPGLRMVGEWSDLEPTAVPGIDPAEVDPAEIAAAAVSGLAGLVADRIGHEA